MARNFLAGPADVDIFVGNNLIATATTLLDSSLTIGSSAEDVRGGIGAKLLGKYFHTSTFDVALTDVLFKLEYLAFQTGSTINQVADLLTEEQVTIGEGNKGKITGTPAEFKTYGTIGWMTEPGSDTYTTVTFTDNSGYEFTAPGKNNGDVVCVKYLATENSARTITIASTFIPQEVSLVMRANLYRAGAGATNLSGSSKAGTLQIEVPRFLFSGSQEISMTSTGVANSPLNGSALDNPADDCSATGYYAKITEYIEGANWYDNVIMLAVEDADIEITGQGTANMIVYAIPANGSSFIAPVADLTFTSAQTGTATVGDHTGVVTGVADGETTISVVITEKPTVEAVANVTVSGNA